MFSFLIFLSYDTPVSHDGVPQYTIIKKLTNRIIKCANKKAEIVVLNQFRNCLDAKCHEDEQDPLLSGALFSKRQ
mgnify:CR=1 FL=1